MPTHRSAGALFVSPHTAAAIKLQAAWRGHQARKALRREAEPEPAPRPRPNPPLFVSPHTRAARRVQSTWRGHKTRTLLATHGPAATAELLGVSDLRNDAPPSSPGSAASSSSQTSASPQVGRRLQLSPEAGGAPGTGSRQRTGSSSTYSSRRVETSHGTVATITAQFTERGALGLNLAPDGRVVALTPGSQVRTRPTATRRAAFRSCLTHAVLGAGC